MNWRRFFFETLALLTMAVLCATVSNLFAGRERRLALPGDYPNALKVPASGSASSSGPSSPVSAAGTASTQPPGPQGSVDPGPDPAGPSAPVPPVQSVHETAPVASSAEAKATPLLEPKSIEKPLPEADLLKRFPPSADKPYREIPAPDVLFLHRMGALFLDARRTKNYEEGHISGARSLSVWESDVAERILALVNEGRKQEMPIVIYCSGGECEDSHMLSEKLFGAGFTNLLLYRDGMPDWVRRGGQTSRGIEP